MGGHQKEANQCEQSFISTYTKKENTGRLSFSHVSLFVSRQAPTLCFLIASCLRLTVHPNRPAPGPLAAPTGIGSHRAAAAASRARRPAVGHERRVGDHGAGARRGRVVVAVRRARPVVADRARRPLGAAAASETAFLRLCLCPLLIDCYQRGGYFLIFLVPSHRLLVRDLGVACLLCLPSHSHMI